MGHRQITTPWILAVDSILQLVCTEQGSTSWICLSKPPMSLYCSVGRSSTSMAFTRESYLHTHHNTPLYTYRHWTHVMASHFTHTDTGHTSWHPTLHLLTLDAHHDTPLYTYWLYTYWHWAHIMATHFTHTNTGHTSRHPTLHIPTLDTHYGTPVHTRHGTLLYTNRHHTHASPVW